MIALIFVLLILFQVKHFLADYPLQTPYMLGKFKDEGWVLPLSAHCGVHALLTSTIVLTINPSLWWLIPLDFVVHFTVDRIKASPKLLGSFKPTEPEFWWSLGLDQAVHHLTHYYIIYKLIKDFYVN